MNIILMHLVFFAPTCKPWHDLTQLPIATSFYYKLCIRQHYMFTWPTPAHKSVCTCMYCSWSFSPAMWSSQLRWIKNLLTKCRCVSTSFFYFYVDEWPLFELPIGFTEASIADCMNWLKGKCHQQMCPYLWGMRGWISHFMCMLCLGRNPFYKIKPKIMPA